MKHFDKPLPRVLTYLGEGWGGGGGGEDSDIFTHMSAQTIFGGSKSFNFNIFGDFQKNILFGGICIYKESTPPPPHTHTLTLGIHVRLSAPGFGAHRICACADPEFHFFSPANFTEGPICLDPLPVSFFLTEN